MADGSGPLASFDFKHPNYSPIYHYRALHIERIREAQKEDPTVVPRLRAYYKNHIPQFISDWGCTFDPRNVERDLPAVIPFVLFPRQREWIEWTIKKWRNREPGLTEKTRDFGLSWISVALACSLCLFYDGMGIGFGSRKEEYVDKIGDPKSLFWKARAFLTRLPREFRGGWVEKKHASHMRLIFPETNAAITGEAGDNVGRGDRKGLYFVDEAAYLEHPTMVDAALSQTTNCQIDISTPNGMGNSFAEKRHKPGMPDDYVFICDWRDDPRKDQAWYDEQKRRLDPVILAQEVDRDYAASVEGVLIPGLWVRAAIDAHVKLGIAPTGESYGAFDVADEGRDLNAYCGMTGFIVDHIEEWSGKGGDIHASTAKVFMICDALGHKRFLYDADGVGADVRGAARVLNEQRTDQSQKRVADSFRGSGAVLNPTAKAPGTDRTNEDFFKNRKAQAWWTVRLRFYRTFLMVEERERLIKGEITADELEHQYDTAEIISIDSKKCGDRTMKLTRELSQPVYVIDGTGKIMVDKLPEGAKSPNMGDAVVMRASGAMPMRVTRAAVEGALRR